MLNKDEHLAEALAQIDRAFARMRKESENTPAKFRKAAREASDDCIPEDEIYTGRRSISDVEFDYYTGQAGGRYFA